MTQVIGLFSNQKEAEQAVRALASAKLGDNDIRTIEEWNKANDTGLEVIPAVNPDSGLAGAAGVGTTARPSLDLSDEEAEFFKRSVLKGGVLVVVDLSESAAVSRATSILEEQGGQVASG